MKGRSNHSREFLVVCTVQLLWPIIKICFSCWVDNGLYCSCWRSVLFLASRAVLCSDALFSVLKSLVSWPKVPHKKLYNWTYVRTTSFLMSVLGSYVAMVDMKHIFPLPSVWRWLSCPPQTIPTGSLHTPTALSDSENIPSWGIGNGGQASSKSCRGRVRNDREGKFSLPSLTGNTLPQISLGPHYCYLFVKQIFASVMHNSSLEAFCLLMNFST